MGERTYKVRAYSGKEYSIAFNDMDDEFGCLYTFPHNDHKKLTPDRVRELALLGAAVVLASWNEEQIEYVWEIGYDYRLTLPNGLPDWIAEEIKRILPTEDDE